MRFQFHSYRLLALLVSLSATGFAQQGFWGTFPENANPREAGKKVVVNLIQRPTMAAQTYGIIYPEVCSGYGAVRFAGAIKDKELLDKLVERYHGMLNTEGGTHATRGPRPLTPGGATPPTTQPGGRRGGAGRGPAGVAPADGKASNMVPLADHVDRSVFGILPMEIYRQTGDVRYLAIGKKSADDQWANPTAEGYTDQSRWWVDDMFMITSLQAEAHRVTHDKVYLDRASVEMAAYLDKLQKPNGLFPHRDDVLFFWGRGDGWFAAGMTELLMELPQDHPKRARIMEGYKKMMAGLLKYQAPDGMWRQLIDNDQAWPETSGTGMFTFAMATGVRRGWLDAAEYKEPARKAWTALCGYVDEKGAVRETSEGTNAYTTSDAKFYLDRRRLLGDLHGQAAFTWAAWAMLD